MFHTVNGKQVCYKGHTYDYDNHMSMTKLNFIKHYEFIKNI